MNFLISMTTFISLVFSLGGTLTASGDFPPASNDHRPFAQLNINMDTKVHLTSSQWETIYDVNKRYWKNRKEIMNNPNIVGDNTALPLLRGWDNWRRELEGYLTIAQMKSFLSWQAEVDLLGERPF